MPSFFPGPCPRQFLEISDFGLGNQLTAFLSEVPLETCGENFELMNSQRTKVKHIGLWRLRAPGVSGGADRTLQKHFSAVFRRWVAPSKKKCLLKKSMSCAGCVWNDPQLDLGNSD